MEEIDGWIIKKRWWGWWMVSTWVEGGMKRAMDGWISGWKIIANYNEWMDGWMGGLVSVEKLMKNTLKWNTKGQSSPNQQLCFHTFHLNLV